MDATLSLDHCPSAPGVSNPGIELVFRQDVRADQISAGELEVLGSALPELIGELLRMTQLDNDPE